MKNHDVKELSPKGTLFSVGLPIGNIDDITLRAKEVIINSDFLACEDTRKTRYLLNQLGIQKHGKLLPHHSYNEEKSARGLLSLLSNGKNISLLADAGSPRISDPGFRIIKLCWEENIKVVPIPGSSALTCLLSVCPLPVEPLLFLGFLSSKSAKRKKILKQYKSFLGSVCFFESVHRISVLLNELIQEWGDQKIFIARELTKKYEEIFLGTLSEASLWVENKKGEFIFLVHKE